MTTFIVISTVRCHACLQCTLYPSLQASAYISYGIVAAIGSVWWRTALVSWSLLPIPLVLSFLEIQTAVAWFLPIGLGAACC